MFQAWNELIPLIIRRAQGIKRTVVKLLLSDLEDSTMVMVITYNLP